MTLGKLTDSKNHLKIGLQLARVFANYWGGEIKVNSMYGYGSDVYVKLDTTGEGIERLTWETGLDE